VRRFNSAFHQTYGRAPRELRRQRFQSSQVENEVILRLAFRPPYDWEQVSDFLSKRAVPGLERVDERGYSRTVAIEDSHAIISVRPIAGENALELRVRNATSAALLQVTSSVRRMFDLAADPAKITLALGSDPLIGHLVKCRPGLRIPGVWDGFECAVRAILGQQVSVSAGRKLAGRLVTLFGRPISPSDERLTYLFHRPTDLAHVNLDMVGIPRARAHALQALALATASGELSFNGSATEIAEALAALPGIGRWTAEYVALRALYEPDAFPASDLVLRRAAAVNGTPLAVQTLEERADAWRPWRGYAAMHLWRSTTDEGKRPNKLSH